MNSAADDCGEEIIDWTKEATGIINDIKSHVSKIEISKELPSCESSIYLNLNTFEGAKYCIHASGMGFRIVANEYDRIDDDKAEVAEDEEIYETPYALLDKISPKYRESFGNKLCEQLRKLSDQIVNDDNGSEK